MLIVPTCVAQSLLAEKVLSYLNKIINLQSKAKWSAILF